MMIQRYVSKISGPLLDRIDIHIDVPSVNYRELRSGAVPESSADIRNRVIRARDVQLERFPPKANEFTPMRRWARARSANIASWAPIPSTCWSGPW